MSTVACQCHCCLPTSTVACRRPLLPAGACCGLSCRLPMPAVRIVVTGVAHRVWSCRGTASQSLEKIQGTHRVQPVTLLVQMSSILTAINSKLLNHNLLATMEVYITKIISKDAPGGGDSKDIFKNLVRCREGVRRSRFIVLGRCAT